jgi:predicted ester cyclase
MSEANKEIVRAFFDLTWNKNDPETAIARYRDPKCVSHGLSHADMSSNEAYRSFLEIARARFKEPNIVMEDVIAEGDKVAFRATLTATYNGRRLALCGFGFARIEGGKIVEAYNGWDAQALLSQVTDAPRSLSDVLRYAMK